MREELNEGHATDGQGEEESLRNPQIAAEYEAWMIEVFYKGTPNG